MAIQSVQAVINGQTYNLTLNAETGKYEAVVTAPSASSFPLTNGYYPVAVTATDTAGNSASVDSTDATLGSNLRLFVKEQVKPTINITSPTAGAYITTNSTSVSFSILDNVNQASGYSGIKRSTVSVTSNNGTVGTLSFTETTGGFTVTAPLTSLTDGNATITVYGEDNDGNTVTETLTFIVDTVAPTLSVASPAEGLETNQSSINVSGLTDDVTSKPVSITIKLNGTDVGPVTVANTGAFSKSLTLTTQGTNTIVITATDAAGKATTVTRHVVYNTSAPVISDVTISPNPVYAGRTYTISVSVTTASV